MVDNGQMESLRFEYLALELQMRLFAGYGKELSVVVGFLCGQPVPLHKAPSSRMAIVLSPEPAFLWGCYWRCFMELLSRTDKPRESSSSATMELELKIHIIHGMDVGPVFHTGTLHMGRNGISISLFWVLCIYHKPTQNLWEREFLGLTMQVLTRHLSGTIGTSLGKLVALCKIFAFRASYSSILEAASG